MDNRTLVRAEALLTEARSMVEKLRDRLQNDYEGKCEEDEKYEESAVGQSLDARISAFNECLEQIEEAEGYISELQLED